MKRLLQELQGQAKVGEFDMYIAGRWLRFSDMDFDFLRHSFRCQDGSVLVNNTCGKKTIIRNIIYVLAMLLQLKNYENCRKLHSLWM